MKRFVDIVVSLLALTLLFPALIVLALLVRWKIGAPVLFVQDRPGRNGVPFRMLKFRSMTDTRDGEGGLLPDSARLTPFGQQLRSWSLDELPELWNILRGDMSLVGPRPLLMQYLPLYSERQIRRHAVRPGLTGWAQVNGRNAIDWEDRLEMDVWYVDNHNLLLDFKILAMTIAKAIRRDGIAKDGEATMSAFRGTRNSTKP